ncbi:DNA-binding transcriptional LysR family regulator [Loktanella ponticola]|uniref:DNA-binding transcriptional LysR family regulator n=1 Tax=Yoonia ponticola TaxID=1524255 RepID=A0A7W9BML0_9RHOB|nr:LysR family transcriptional regulator [Yoonia ponticola]MBB5723225.1 DNA-binding transcriptional LysR family regulator [Yoonia ponticola]
MSFNWDDLRVFLEIQRTGRQSQAAKRLKYSHTTIARRLKALQDQLGLALFEQTKDGMVLSEFGQRILPFAEQMEGSASAISDLAGRINGVGKQKVRVGAPDGFGNEVLSHILPRLIASNPTLEIDLVPMPIAHKLWRRDVDIAISLDRPERGALVMRKLIDYDLRIYAGPKFFEGRERPKQRADLHAYPFIGYVEELLYTDTLDFNTILLPDLQVVYRGSTVKAQFDAVMGNIGLGVLPYYMARDTDLEPVLADKIEFQRTYWMTYLEENRHLARIQQTSEFIVEATRELSDIFKYRRK